MQSHEVDTAWPGTSPGSKGQEELVADQERPGARYCVRRGCPVILVVTEEQIRFQSQLLPPTRGERILIVVL